MNRTFLTLALVAGILAGAAGSRIVAQLAARVSPAS